MSSSPYSDPRHRSGLRGALVTGCFRFSFVALLLLFLLQSIFLHLFFWGIPEPFVDRLQQELKKNGWQVSYADLAFRFPASLSVTNPRFARMGDDETLAQAEYATVRLSVRELLRGNVRIKRGHLYGGMVFCPSSHSPTGAREVVLERAYASVGQKGGALRIHSLVGQIQNLSVTASGTIPSFPEPYEPEIEVEDEPLDWESLIAQVLPRIIEERATFERAGNPRLRLTFSPSATGGLTIEGEAWADAVVASDEIQVIRPRLASVWNFDGSHWQGTGGSLQTEGVTWHGDLSPGITATAAGRSVSGKVYWASIDEGDNLLPDEAHLSIGEFETPAGSFTGIQTVVSLAGPEQIAIDLFAFFQDEPLEATAHLDWGAGDGRVDLVSRINPTPIFQHEMVRELGLKPDIAFETAPFARAEAHLDSWQFTGASGNAHARQATIDGVYLDQASAHAKVDSSRFIVPEMVLVRDDFQTTGFYEVDFDSKAYRLLFKGTVRPLHIQGWFRDWWTGLWEAFDFPEKPVGGDVDITSVHGRGEEVRLFGSVDARAFSLREVPFESFDTRIVVRHRYVELFDTFATREQGEARGWFQYHANPDNGGMERIDFKADSNFDPIEVSQIFGEAGQNVTSHFQFSVPPSLLLEGTVYGPPRQSENRVTVTGRTEDPLVYDGLALDRLMVDALLEGSDWNLRQIDAGLAGGKVSGDARKWREDGEDHLRFSLIMNGLDIPRSLEQLSRWRQERGLEETSSSTPSPQKIGGVADLVVQGSGLFGDVHSFTGGGNIEIRDADLAQVHLLGLLSRMLSVTPFAFTSLQFTKAEADFLLEKENLHVSELLLTGPTAEIHASGDYAIDQDALDFALKLHLMRESRIPFLSLLLSPVLEPLAHVMEIRLTGPFADPQWRFLLGPRNIFGGPAGTEIDPEDLLEEDEGPGPSPRRTPNRPRTPN